MDIQYLEPAPGRYRPGACNIGPREIAKRRASGIVGVGSAVVLGAWLVAIDAPALSRLIVVLPQWVGLSGFEQARRRFCARFAWAGIRSVSDSDAIETVGDPRDLAADRAAAWILVGYCGAIAMAVAVAFALLPV